MKRKGILLLLMVSSSLLLFGCKSETEASPVEIVSTDEIEDTSTEDTSESVTEETETNDEIPPAEGMVRSTLTNEWIDGELEDQRPIAVMYPINKVALPQYGLDNIDIFYECLEEGKMSRQLGIIKDWKNLDQIGNIRSIRDYFVYWALEWDSIIVHFGGPEIYVSDILLRADVDNLNGTGAVSMGSDYGAYFRVPEGSRSEHTAFTSGEKLLQAIDKAAFSLEYRNSYYQPDHFMFASKNSPNTLENAEGVMDATEIDMSKCFPVTKSSLTYNAEEGVYEKFIYGNPQVDATSGNQLKFANVIVQNTYYEQRDKNDYLYFQVHDTKRDGYYFTQGKAIHITWKKDGNNGVTSNYTPTKYYDDNGNEITLNTGKTMIFIVQDGNEVIFN